MSRPNTVTSIHGTRYSFGHELGRGGEGAVFAVEGGRLAVKLLRDRSPRSRDRLRDRLAMVGRLPLEGLAVARPIEQLRPPHVGYVMELFTGMVPIRSLLHPPKGIGSVTEWYFQGGGLRRRLRILARVAEVVSELHGRGLVYADLSPNNVFVSKPPDAGEVRLIDTDNVHPATSQGQSIYTPRYGAPEVVRRTGVASSLGDAWTFAVVAFETLALVHPLLGDKVQYGEPEMEEQALKGRLPRFDAEDRLPWIDAEDDDRNRSSDGIPREIVLSPRLREDFGRAFGPGLSDPAARPGLARWTERLHAAADRTVTCSECSGSYFCDRDRCSWCDAPRPPFVMARVLLWDPDRRHAGDGGRREVAPGLMRGPTGRPLMVDMLAISANEPVVLTERITLGTSGRTPRLRVGFAEGRITLESLDGGEWRLASSDGRSERRIGKPPVDLAIRDSGAAWLVHAGPEDRLHRVIRFDLRQGNSQ